MLIETDTIRWHFTESWKIFTAYTTITDIIFPARIFFWHAFSVCKTIDILIFFTDRINDRMWNYRQTTCWRTLSVGDLVDKKFIDEVAILYQQIWSVGKTIKCCSEQLNKPGSFSGLSPKHIRQQFKTTYLLSFKVVYRVSNCVDCGSAADLKQQIYGSYFLIGTSKGLIPWTISKNPK